MKTTRLFFLISIVILTFSCGKDDDDNLGLENYSFSLDINTDLGNAAKVQESLRVGIVLSDIKSEKAEYVTKIYSASPASSSIIINNKEVASSDKTFHNYGTENTLFFNFIGTQSGIYIVTIEVENNKFHQKKEIEIIVTADYNITVTCNDEQGIVSGTGTYKEGVTAELTATAKTGYVFRGWYIENQLVSDNLKYLLVIEKSLVAEARFEKDTFNNFANAENGGTISGSGKYLFQDDVTLSTTHPTLYYEFKGWYVDGIKVSDEVTYKFKAVSNITAIARWEDMSIDCTIIKSNIVLMISNNYSTNGGHIFKSFQWYKNGYPIQGETKQYIGLGEGLPYGVPYFCKMVTDEGKTVYSKPVTLYN